MASTSSTSSHCLTVMIRTRRVFFRQAQSMLRMTSLQELKGLPLLPRQTRQTKQQPGQPQQERWSMLLQLALLLYTCLVCTRALRLSLLYGFILLLLI